MVFNPGTNPYFNNFHASNEQDLYDNLIQESIKIYGIDLYYLPRTLVAFDQLYGEDTISEYNSAIPIEMYLKSVDGFEGDGTFLGKLGLEIRDQVVFTVSRKTFLENVGSHTAQSRPEEGDLIWYPLNNKLFQVKYVNYLPIHYPLGTLQTWDLTCELYEYSNERINTGIADIDALQTTFSTNILDYSLVDEAGNPVIDENGDYITSEVYAINQANTATVGSDSEQIQGEANDALDWSESNPFSELTY